MRLSIIIFLLSTGLAQIGYTQTQPTALPQSTTKPEHQELNKSLPKSTLKKNQTTTLNRTSSSLQDTTRDTNIIPPEPKKASPFAVLKMFSGNPGKAMLYSALLPGAGQIYNNRLWKAPIVWGIEGTAIGILIHNQNKYKLWKSAHAQLVADQSISINGTNSPATALAQRDKWENNRDYAIIGLAAVHLIQMMDAFINRHLIEFDVSDDLSIDFAPLAPYPGMHMVVHF